MLQDPSVPFPIVQWLLIGLGVVLVLLVILAVSALVDYYLEKVRGRVKAGKLCKYLEGAYPLWRSFDELRNEAGLREKYLPDALGSLIRQKFVELRVSRYGYSEDFSREEVRRHLVLRIVLSRSVDIPEIEPGIIPMYEFRYCREPLPSRRIEAVP